MDSPATVTIDVGPISIDFLVDANDSGGSVTVFECAVPAEAKVPIPDSVDAKFLAIATPGVFGPSYFRDVAQVLAAAAGGPPDLAALAKAMRRHGLTPAQPVTT